MFDNECEEKQKTNFIGETKKNAIEIHKNAIEMGKMHSYNGWFELYIGYKLHIFSLHACEQSLCTFFHHFLFTCLFTLLALRLHSFSAPPPYTFCACNRSSLARIVRDRYFLVIYTFLMAFMCGDRIYGVNLCQLDKRPTALKDGRGRWWGEGGLKKRPGKCITKQTLHMNRFREALRRRIAEAFHGLQLQSISKSIDAIHNINSFLPYYVWYTLPSILWILQADNYKSVCYWIQRRDTIIMATG